MNETTRHLVERQIAYLEREIESVGTVLEDARVGVRRMEERLATLVAEMSDLRESLGIVVYDGITS